MIQIIIYKPAECDLIDIEYYISIELCNPQASDRITDGIMEVIKKTKDYPESHALVEDEYWSRVGIRKVLFENYNIFYHYDSKTQQISILRILHEKECWKNKLKF